MGKLVLKDAYVSIAGTVLSDHASSVTLEDTAEEIDFTAFSANGYREFGQGLKDANVTVTFFSDYDAGSVDAVLFPLYASGGTFGLEIRPSSGAASPTNPKYTMVSRMYSYSPISGGVGDALSTDVTFRNAGTAGLVRGTS
jgi:hypothetical protein